MKSWYVLIIPQFWVLNAPTSGPDSKPAWMWERIGGFFYIDDREVRLPEEHHIECYDTGDCGPDGEVTMLYNLRVSVPTQWVAAGPPGLREMCLTSGMDVEIRAVRISTFLDPAVSAYETYHFEDGVVLKIPRRTNYVTWTRRPEGGYKGPNREEVPIGEGFVTLDHSDYVHCWVPPGWVDIYRLHNYVVPEDYDPDESGWWPREKLPALPV